MAGETVIFVMDSDLCPNCDALLEYPDQCIECGYGWLWIDDGDEEDDLYTDFGDYDERAYHMGEYDEEE